MQLEHRQLSYMCNSDITKIKGNRSLEISMYYLTLYSTYIIELSGTHCVLYICYVC